MKRVNLNLRLSSGIAGYFRGIAISRSI
jgi:hypothetical protein